MTKQTADFEILVIYISWSISFPNATHVRLKTNCSGMSSFRYLHHGTWILYVQISFNTHFLSFNAGIHYRFIKNDLKIITLHYSFKVSQPTNNSLLLICSKIFKKTTWLKHFVNTADGKIIFIKPVNVGNLFNVFV